MCFSDPYLRDYAFLPTRKWDRVVIYPTEETVARGNVDIDSGKGVLEIVDTEKAPEAPLLIAAYVELLRNQRGE